MSALLTQREMSIWTAADIATIASDPFAKEVNDKVGEYICFLAGHPEWNASTVPVDVKTVALWMVKRTYTNPDQETSSNVGPIGSRVLDVAAMAMALTESEAAVLQGYKDEATGGGQTLYVMGISNQRGRRAPADIYVTDDQQININTTNAAPEWEIPWTTGDDVNQPVTP